MYIDQFRAWMDAHEHEMTQDLKALIRIPSERMEARPGMPFGPEAARALRTAKTMMEKYGLSVTDYDHYVVAGDMNPCPKGLDILAHLDVVPEGEDWTVTSAYVPVVRNGKIYGRGAMDNKGPAVAALYAMRAVMDLGIPLNKNVRLILGSDEESSSSDLEYYYARETEAPCTFSPDAEFPVINVEKGGLHSSFSKKFDGKAASGARLISAEAGTRVNVVPGKARALVSGISMDVLKRLGGEVEKETKVRFSFANTYGAAGNENTLVKDGACDGAVEITAIGSFAHAASPEDGNNALTALILFISRLPLDDVSVKEAFSLISSLYPHGDFYGNALGVAMSDEISGPLTMSLNMLTFGDGCLNASFDCRAPLCASDANVRDGIAKKLDAGGFCLDDRKMYAAHYVPGDSSFVKTLLSCYTDVTGLPGKTVAIGGGTYVHDLKYGVAFGCCMEGVDNHLHGADEFVDIEHLKTCAVIFAEAIVRLCGQ